MKKTTKKLAFDRTTIATLSRKSLLLAVGGTPAAPATPRPTDK